MSKQLRDLSPVSVKKALSRLNQKLPTMKAEEAHDRLVSILVRAIYDRDGSGNFLWAHDLAIVRKIISKKPEIRQLAWEWFCGIRTKKRKK